MGSVAMSVSDLRDLIRSLAGRPSQCTEKQDLFNLAKQLLNRKTCLVCLDELLVTASDTVIRLPCCGSVLHTSCLGEWILKSTQEGVYPHKCVCCAAVLEDQFITKRILVPGDASGKYLRYVAALDGLNQLRNNKGKSSMSQHEQEALRRQGFRKCPSCGAWIEKGPALEAFGIPVAEGCDKMTCRCGCQFCFKCGALNAACTCTGADHGFFSHQEVLSDYPRSHVGSSGLFGGLF